MSEPTLIGHDELSMREAFGQILVKLAPKYDFVVFDCDVASGTGTHHFRDAYPDRFYQFGIAEQNAMSAAAGFASTGVPVFVTTMACFALRAWEMARLSIGYANANVKIVASHVGLEVGPDGASAQSIEDIACFRAIPGVVVISPADALELEYATVAILEYDGPVYMRTGRNAQPRIYAEYKNGFRFGKIMLDGYHKKSEVTLIATGVMLYRAMKARQKLKVMSNIINVASIKPLEPYVITALAKKTNAVVTCEDHSIIGGLGSAVAEVLAQHHPCPIEFVGVRDAWGESGTPEELAVKYGLTSDDIVKAALRVIERKNATK